MYRGRNKSIKLHGEDEIIPGLNTKKLPRALGSRRPPNFPTSSSFSPPKPLRETHKENQRGRPCHGRKATWEEKSRGRGARRTRTVPARRRKRWFAPAKQRSPAASRSDGDDVVTRDGEERGRIAKERRR